MVLAHSNRRVVRRRRDCGTTKFEDALNEQAPHVAEQDKTDNDRKGESQRHAECREQQSLLAEQRGDHARVDTCAVRLQRPHRVIDHRALDIGVVQANHVVATEERLRRSDVRVQATQRGVEPSTHEILLIDIEELCVLEIQHVDQAVDRVATRRTGTQLHNFESHLLEILGNCLAHECHIGRVRRDAARRNLDETGADVFGDWVVGRRWRRGCTRCSEKHDQRTHGEGAPHQPTQHHPYPTNRTRLGLVISTGQ